jgi:conjugative relaxase-like TrwC/TraI family protein
MVCSIGNPYSNLQDYAEENFVTKNQTITNSRWYGKGAMELGLSNQVTSFDYQRAYQGKNSSGNSLRRQLKNKNSVPGRDLTFSAPKSVSLLGLVRQDMNIINAHERAVNAALKYIEQNCIFTRTGAGGTNLQQTNNMMVAVFQHQHSRNLDPNLHSHCVIFNQTQGDDGKWRSMDNRQLYQQKMTIGMIYHHELSQQLMELGHSINWNLDGTFDVAGFKSSQLKQFSSRRTEIINLAGENSSSKTKARACVSTRNTKKYVNAEERITLRESWQQTFKALNISVETNPKDARSLVSIIKSQELIEKSIQSLSERDGKTQFFEHELLKEVLMQAKGQHQLNQLQKDIKQHPSLIPTDNKLFTTIDLYRQEKTRQREENLRVSVNNERATFQENFSFHEIKDDIDPIAQTIARYLQLEEQKPGRTVILTDTKQDEINLTLAIRQKLISQNKLGEAALSTVILQPKNLAKPDITNLVHYQVGDAIKFNRKSSRFSDRHFYKVLSIDANNRILHLGDRFGHRAELPLDRYQNREVFQVQKRELRLNEKMRFSRGQYIQGKQFSAGQSFIITKIKDKQQITIKVKDKQLIVNSDNLFFTEYNYADTVKKEQGKNIEHCLYYSSPGKSAKVFQQDIYTVADRINAQLTVYTSDNLLKPNISLNTQQQLQSNMDFLERPSEVNRAIDDTLFDLASSANYLINHALKNESNLEKQEVYYSPDGITIEKNPQNLSIFYDGKLLQVDRDFNVVKNELDRHEIKELVQKIALIKEQSKELDRTKQIEQNRGLSL